MKAARKVGDAKKHECTFTQRSPELPFNFLRSKTRILGLIRSDQSIMLCVCSQSQHYLRTLVPHLPLCPKIYSKSPYEFFQDERIRRKGVLER